MLSRHPFADALKARDDVRLIHVTPEIRDRALNEAVAAVREMLR